MKKLKAAFCFTLLIITLIGAYGCMEKMTRADKAEREKELALAYLNEKYDDSFSPVRYTGKSIAYDYSSLEFRSSKYDAVFELRVTEEGDERIYTDNYHCLFMREDAEKFFSIIADSMDSKAKIRFPGSVWSDGIGGSSSFSEYVSSGKCNMDVYFLSTEEIDDIMASELCRELAEKKICGTYKFATVKSIEEADAISLDELINGYSKYITDEKTYYISRYFEVKKM